MPVLGQGRNGYFSFNAGLIPCYSWASESPDNIVAPAPVGNSWSTAYAQGLQTGRFSAEIMVREKATEVLDIGFWNAFLSRTFSGGLDDTATNAIVGSDSLSTFTHANAKAESFVLRVQKGAAIGLSAVFVSPAKPTIASSLAAAYAPIDGTAPMMFDRASFTGISDEVYGFQLAFANNHVPNGPLGAAYGKALKSWDAGVIACTCSITVNAKAGNTQPFTTGSEISIALTNGSVTRTLTLASVVPNNPRNRAVNPSAVFQTYECLVLGTSTNPPLRAS